MHRHTVEGLNLARPSAERTELVVVVVVPVTDSAEPTLYRSLLTAVH